MQTNLAPEYLETRAGQEAESILRKCVHCGFCTATCPTYQLLGDELDGPRGRIYLIKQVLEGEAPTRATQQHLDRCLTCRNCETTCPSGVQYGHLVDIGRKVVDAKVQRPLGERAKRWALREGLNSSLFAPAMKLGQKVRPLLPASIQAKVPAATPHGVWPTREHARKVLLLAGCVQPAMLPNINYATARVLDAVGIQTVVADAAGCCGAVKLHLGDEEGALQQMRRNIDARRSPTSVNNLATQRSFSWFENNLIYRVPENYPGAGRRVYPGFLQYAGFVAMNPDRHANSHYDYFKDLLKGDDASAEHHRKFYDEYNAVLDMDADYYLETIETVFQEYKLVNGTWDVANPDGALERVHPEHIRSTALMTVEGELDDISGSGQTRAAHDLCTQIPEQHRKHMEVQGAGHYGIFSGRRWREVVYPTIKDFILAHHDPKQAVKAAGPAVPAQEDESPTALTATSATHHKRRHHRR